MLKKSFIVLIAFVLMFSSCTVQTFALDQSTASQSNIEQKQAAKPELVGTEFHVRTLDELEWINGQINGGNNLANYKIVLLADIDMKGKDWPGMGYNLNNYFAGVFDGQGHIIKNFKASGNVDSYSILNAPRHSTGLFGSCIGATVKNLIIDNASYSIINSSGYQNSYSSINGTCIYGGAISGYAKDSTFQNIVVCNSKITVDTQQESGNAYAGGLVGYSENSNFIHCCSEKNIVYGNTSSLVGDSYAGGIVGELSNEGIIRQSYSTSEVSSINSSAQASYLGGIVGKTSNNTQTLSTIRDCYNQGNVRYRGSYLDRAFIGGIVGLSNSTINRCYNACIFDVSTNTVTDSDVKIGGIVGVGEGATSISNCAVMGTRFNRVSYSAVISNGAKKDNNIAQSDINAQLNDENRTYDNSNFLSSDLYTNELGWNFKYIWQTNNNSYPTLLFTDTDKEKAIQIVDEAATQVKIEFSQGDYYDRVTKKITFTSANNGATVKWSTSNENVVSSLNGNVTRQQDDYRIRIQAKISYEDYSVTKTFYIKVLGQDKNAPVVDNKWAMSVDDARNLVSIMRGEIFKNVKANDPDVLVLTGNNINESDVIDTVSKVVKSWEVPGESSIIKQNMGDIVGLIKSGQDQVISSLIGDFSDGYVKWDPNASSAEVNTQAIAQDLVQIPKSMYNFEMNVTEGYNKFKDLSNFEFKDNLLDTSLDYGKKVANCIDYTQKVTQVDKPIHIKSGNIIGFISNANTAFKLYKAFEITRQNAVKSYLSTYMQNRPYYESPDDPAFKLIMEAVLLTNIKMEIEDIDVVAEQLYQLNKKFGGNLSDEYKITIKCPVDVIVYDQSGKIVGKVINNVVDKSIYNSVRISIGGKNNDEKTIYIQDKEKYNIELVGNDTGVMNVDIENKKGNNKEIYSYNDIALTPNKTMNFDVSEPEFSSENKDLPVINVVEDGIVTDVVEENDIHKNKHLINISSCVENDGKLELSTIGGQFESRYLEKDTPLRPLIKANNGYIFDDLYTDIDCKIPYASEVMPNENINLYAKFIKNNTGIVIVTQPKSDKYIVGDQAKELSVEVNTTDHYTYQWYKYTDKKENAVAIKNATNRSYVPSTSEPQVVYYFVRITNVVDGVEQTLDSSSAKITVEPKTMLGKGTCGQDINWGLTVEGVLTIDGIGRMNDFTESNVPWSEYKSSIKSINIEEGVTYIGNYAFAGCSELVSFKAPDSLESIGEKVLTGCSKLQTMEIPFVGKTRTENNTNQAVFGNWFGKENSGVTQYYVISGNSLSGYSYAIPSSLKKVHVTSATIIPFGGFSNCSMLSEIIIDKTIQNISGYSFYACTKLKELSIPKSVVSIDESALKDCNSLQKLSIPFLGKNRTINNSYESTLGYIFGTCEDREKNCVVQYYKLNGTQLSGYAFGIPDSLIELIITDADQLSFGSLSNIKKITKLSLNSGLKLIDDFAFYNVTGLQDIYFNDWETEWTKIQIKQYNDFLDTCTIHYLDALSKLYGASLRLTGDIGVNFYYEFKEEALNDPKTEICFKLNGQDYSRLKLSDAVIDTKSCPGKTLYKFTVFVAAAQMQDIITTNVMTSNGLENERQYSIRKYADNILKGKYSNELKELVKVMMYYGGNSQLYTEYNTNLLASKGLNLRDIENRADTITAEQLNKYSSSITAMPPGIELYGANLSLKSETVLRYHFNLEDGYNIADYHFTIDGIEYTPILKDGRYCVEINNIKAQNIDKMYRLVVTDKLGNSGEIIYGALTYAKNVIKYGTAKYKQSLIDTVKALYLYNQAAEAYIATL